MNVSNDSYFRIGDQHVRSGLPCQDYAHSGRSNLGIHYAIVSDGCSASPDTDVGSRMLVHWFREQLDTFPAVFPANPEEYKSDSLGRDVLLQRFRDYFSTMWVKNLIPHRRCLDATIVAAFIHRAYDQGYIIVIGDGAFAIKNKSGRLETFYVHSDWNAPPYLSYLLDDNAKRCYIDMARGNSAKLVTQRMDHDQDSVEEISCSNSEEVLKMGGLVYTFDPKTTQTVAVFTDGAGSFGTDKQVSPHYVMADMMNIKSPAGIFVARTCMSNLRDYNKRHIGHYDDFAMAALRFNEEESDTKNTSEGSRQVTSDSKPE